MIAALVIACTLTACDSAMVRQVVALTLSEERRINDSLMMERIDAYWSTPLPEFIRTKAEAYRHKLIIPYADPIGPEPTGGAE